MYCSLLAAKIEFLAASKSIPSSSANSCACICSSGVNPASTDAPTIPAVEAPPGILEINSPKGLKNESLSAPTILLNGLKVPSPKIPARPFQKVLFLKL